MNDCPNADVRDLLPDLVHERLDAEARAMVEAHIALCTDCAAELELLRQLRATRRTPRVDVASIVAAVPAYRAPARRTWVGWRAAAVITVMVAGASSIAVLQRGVPSSVDVNAHTVAETASTPVAHDNAIVAKIAKAPTALPSAPDVHAPSVSTPNPAPRASAVPRAVRELAMSGGALGDLNDRELASLLKDIESLDAVPSVEVESSPTSPIAPSTPARP